MNKHFEADEIIISYSSLRPAIYFVGVFGAVLTADGLYTLEQSWLSALIEVTLGVWLLHMFGISIYRAFTNQPYLVVNKIGCRIYYPFKVRHFKWHELTGYKISRFLGFPIFQQVVLFAPPEKERGKTKLRQLVFPRGVMHQKVEEARALVLHYRPDLPELD